VSTRSEQERRALGGGWPTREPPGWTRRDSAEEVALVAQSRRELLLRAHRHRLGREDLEDCYSQATLELMVHARKGGGLATRAHTANVLEQRFLSRIYDRRRALTGRSPMQAALHTALSLSGEGEVELVDPRADVERLAMLRFELGLLERVAPALSSDQRLVLACQVSLQMSRGEFCRRYGWTTEKYRKVAQRARLRLRRLLAEADEAETPRPRGGEAEDEIARSRVEVTETKVTGPGSGPPEVFAGGCPPSEAMSE
jgi:DNA-directed RNA polymerase specialized sigma24 family protein